MECRFCFDNKVAAYSVDGVRAVINRMLLVNSVKTGTTVNYLKADGFISTHYKPAQLVVYESPYNPIILVIGNGVLAKTLYYTIREAFPDFEDFQVEWALNWPLDLNCYGVMKWQPSCLRN